jgi:hypothetical protein
MWRRTEPTVGLTSAHQTSHTPTPRSRYLLTPTHAYQTHTPHTLFLLMSLSPSPLHTHTQDHLSSRHILFISISLDLSHFSCYLSLIAHTPPLSAPLLNTYTYPLQALPNTSTTHSHMLHLIMCSIDLKSPLFTFTSHTRFLLN